MLINPDGKHSRYQWAREQLVDIIEKTDDTIAQMTTVAAVLFHKMSTFYSVGFYRLLHRLLAFLKGR